MVDENRWFKEGNFKHIKFKFFVSIKHQISSSFFKPGFPPFRDAMLT